MLLYLALHYSIHCSGVFNCIRSFVSYNSHLVYQLILFCCCNLKLSLGQDIYSLSSSVKFPPIHILNSISVIYFTSFWLRALAERGEVVWSFGGREKLPSFFELQSSVLVLFSSVLSWCSLTLWDFAIWYHINYDFFSICFAEGQSFIFKSLSVGWISHPWFHRSVCCIFGIERVLGCPTGNAWQEMCGELCTSHVDSLYSSWSLPCYLSCSWRSVCSSPLECWLQFSAWHSWVSAPTALGQLWHVPFPARRR